MPISTIAIWRDLLIAFKQFHKFALCFTTRMICYSYMTVKSFFACSHYDSLYDRPPARPSVRPPVLLQTLMNSLKDSHVRVISDKIP